MNQKVDVIIPVKNGQKFLSKSIETVLNQSVSTGLIVVNDHSSDSTSDIIKSYAQKFSQVRVLNNSGHGVSNARNLGISQSLADYIAFLDSDDLWTEDKIQKQISFLEANPKYGACFCGTVNIDENDFQISNSMFLPLKDEEGFHSILINRTPVSGSASSVMVRRKILEVAGFFNPKLSIGEDWDLWIRIARQAKFGCIKEPLVKIRIHEMSTQRKADSLNISEIFLQRMMIFSKWWAVCICSKSFLIQFVHDLTVPTIKFLKKPSLFLPFNKRFIAISPPLYLISLFLMPAVFINIIINVSKKFTMKHRGPLCI